jgi:DNA-binding winged helix-turn-helix (wHTH) protein/tetratricopeptide (TPR) repeat protein
LTGFAVSDGGGLLYCFGNCTLDAPRRELRRNDALQRVEPQVLDLLLFLIENRDRVVSRDEIFEQVWGNRIVSDSVLSTRIHAVRHAIGDNGLDQRLIRTIHGRGFRFVAPLREVNPLVATGTADRSTTDAYSVDQAALAVMPFRCDANECHPFGEEIAEHIMLCLSGLSWLHIIPSSVAFSIRRQSAEIRQLSRALGAAYLLEGKFRLLAEGLQVFVELIDAETGRQIWVERYKSKTHTIQSIHKEIASKIVPTIKKHLSRSAIISAWRKQASNLSVWDYILRAIALINTRRQSDWVLAGKLLLEAVKKDPASVQAHALLSYVTTVGVAAGWGHRKRNLALSIDAGHQALLFNDDDPWAQVAMGFALAWDRRPEDAVLHYKQALRLDPAFSYAQTLLGAALCYLGKHREALVETLAARQFADADLFGQGNAGVNNNTIAISHFVAGNYRRGLEFGQRALLESPQLPTTHRFLIINQALNGDAWHATRGARRLKQLVPNTSLKTVTEWLPFVRTDERQRIVEACRMAGLN